MGLADSIAGGPYRTGHELGLGNLSGQQRKGKPSEPPNCNQPLPNFVADPPRVRHSCEKSATEFENLYPAV